MNRKERQQAAWTTAATIMTLAWPTIVEQVMQTAVQYIDTAMVGSLGTQATAAVGATSTIAWLVGSTFSALGVGFLALIAKACGAGDLEAAKKAAAQTSLVVLVAGIFATIVCTAVSGMVPVWMQVDPAVQELAGTYFFILYLPMLFRSASILFGTVLRAAGDTKTPMWVGIIVNCINIVLNFLLIYDTRTVSLLGLRFAIPGAGWGVTGAAAASALSYVWGGIHITWVLWRHPLVSPKGMSLKPDMSILRPCVKIAFPNMLQRFGTSLGYVVFAAMINSLGEVATAAHTIANTVESAFYIPGYGMQTAAATLAGNAYGAGDRKRMKSLANMFLPIEVVLMILSGAALFFSAPLLVGIFTKSREVITLGSTVLRMVAVSEPFYGVSIIMEGLMMGVGKTKVPFLYNITGMWCIRILGAMICIRFLEMGLVSAWACMIAHNMLLFCFYLATFVRGSWNPLNTE
ncbi:MAG: MATE family efflux transporter [Dysosmobacter sp.]|uniref:MATE family efflux transporter n=1 Tax=uncultured Oscillibacter sp. TaxID=876091 RepID=UPI002613F12C|nr:MATE family efflux transporter [uncultured Oscillibacter sp.]MCX4373031.1 MATE family efflux transporter [Dysosmobacter sp.]